MSRRASFLSRTSSMTSQGKKESAEEVSIDFLTGGFLYMQEGQGVVLLGDKRHGLTSMECVQALVDRGTISRDELGMMFFEGKAADAPSYGTPLFMEDDLTLGRQRDIGTTLDEFVATKRCTIANPQWADRVAHVLRGAPRDKINIFFCGADHLRKNLPGEKCDTLQEELQKRNVPCTPYIFKSDHEEVFKEEEGGAVILYNFTAEL
eukprot:CAMPEP_0204578210 /NCGR_PEP_ID=MMETSP0661-20131031/42788_1 /ASSEMBLY_ACC=CAM_ASM_000606 /TAXON_ID=109239 /ORGANISM="Alexandrium margalefi, Strain AMGDE01CS-322" /LENGTH=206 /DNA_ID=CAMNT_0051587119 /DNA_START=65 /DNA_END=685 /DNA_ORIENTATION=+